MLNSPPPGYNSSAINTQNVSPFNVPGLQGATAQGYNPYRSSYTLPSSYSVPSTYPTQNNYYAQQAAQMAKALRG